jgi:hypothetical protein
MSDQINSGSHAASGTVEVTDAQMAQLAVKFRDAKTLHKYFTNTKVSDPDLLTLLYSNGSCLGRGTAP